MEVKKLCKMQDSGLKRVPYNSGETSINLSNDVVEILLGSTIIRPSNTSVKLRLYKSDFIQGLCYIITQLPLYNSSSQGYKKVEYSMDLYNKYLANINAFFENSESKDQYFAQVGLIDNDNPWDVVIDKIMSVISS